MGAAQGVKAAACRIFDDAVAAAAEKGPQGEKTYAFLVVSHAHFLMQSYKDIDAARAAFAAALQKAPGSITLWEGAIHLEESVDAPVRTCVALNFLCEVSMLLFYVICCISGSRSMFWPIQSVSVQ